MKAFPTHGTMGEVVQEGMDLRDYFASDVMKALLSLEKTQQGIAEEKVSPKEITVVCYQWADLMMEARK
jgi:hypothetical protein